MAKKKSKKKNKKTSKRAWIIGLSIAFGVLAILCILFLNYYKDQKIHLSDNKKEAYLYIPTNATFKDVCDSITNNHYISDLSVFYWLSERMQYPQNVKAGRYELKKGMNVYSLLKNLRSGNQKPIQLRIGKSRTKEDFVGKISKKIEADSITLLAYLNDPIYLDQYNLNLETALTLFIPNTYEIFWNTSATKFISRMKKENEKFWNKSRLEKAQDMNLTPTQVVILASIVDEETNRKDEKPTVSSVYLNRLRIGMKLQADPTARFAAKGFELQRINGRVTKVDSPYNTYINFGLPPGPICIPGIESIDAVLENKVTDYLFFCARPDFSGYHNFARTNAEHERNAAEYHRFLNEKGIR